ncbi:DUF3784 domain-containing protein [Halopiger goleimassiliensis]|uniref:DUF3784 domain-containing protein n=1 Tax=Halopiger goleimassiliensis TaxID=1293048 RepID=UPI0006775AF9|nr:DUF3784 domain-containing protein [Halopiger goleimassiliensis]
MVRGTVLSLLAAAAFVGLLGALVKYAGQTWLIAGYDPDRVTDEEGLANFIGTNALYVAGLLFVLAGLEYAEPVDETLVSLLWVAFAGVVLVIGVRMLTGARRYQADAPDGTP